MSKLAIISGKGGIGKTTLAVNLGYILQKDFGIDIAIVDCNLTTPHLGISLGIYNYSKTLNDLLKSKRISNIDNFFVEHPSGLKILPASMELRDLEKVDIMKLPSLLQKYNSNLILDSAPGLGREGLAALTSADEILFVTQPFTNAVVDIYRVKKVAEELNKKIIGIVVNYRRNLKHELTQEEIEQLTELLVIETIPYDIEIEKANAAKLPLPLFNPGAKSLKNFYSLASKISGIELPPPKKSFFSKIKRIFGRNR